MGQSDERVAPSAMAMSKPLTAPVASMVAVSSA